jgi:hypothetical protein
MDSSVVAGLKAALTTDNIWLERSTIAVFVGVIVEMGDLLVFNKEMTRLQRGVLFVATLLIMAGCGGEWFFEHQATALEGQLQQISDAKVAGLARDEAADNKIATQAAAKAGALGVKVDKLPDFVKAKEDEISRKSSALEGFANAVTQRDSATAAELTRDSAALNRARDDAQGAAAAAETQLETMRRERAPRGFSPQQEKNFVAHLEQFSGTTVGIWRADTTSPDTLPFADAIGDLLAKAKWIARGTSISHAARASAVNVLVRSGAPKSAEDAANALVSELTADGFSALRGPAFTDEKVMQGNAIAENVFGGTVPDVLVFVGTRDE